MLNNKVITPGQSPLTKMNFQVQGSAAQCSSALDKYRKISNLLFSTGGYVLIVHSITVHSSPEFYLDY